jgi:hypothetical protein
VPNDGPRGGASVVVVWEIVWIYSDVVGFRVLEEAHGFDVGEALEERLANAVHAVHDAAIAGENDGKAEVGVADEASVIDDLAAGDRFCGVAVPVGLIEFADGGDWHTLSRQSGGEFDETVNVPGTETLG